MPGNLGQPPPPWVSIVSQVRSATNATVTAAAAVQMKDRTLNRPSHRLRQGLNLLPGLPRKPGLTITH